MTTFGSFYGIITRIDDFNSGSEESLGCYKIMTVQKIDGNIVNFIITPTTYFVYNTMMVVGDVVIGFYDMNAPVPLIFPPQFRAIAMSKIIPGQNIKVDYFNEKLVSSDGTLKLNIAPSTQIVLENGQIFTKSPKNRNLIVIYGPTTRSIPAQTTPYKIIVMCPKT
ncbi:hypothetical protein [Maledivibacter halophilus]|uniref:Uncharacterized protein n=1 Tax=Maledivibacter halophilus TaxID=36842 RepID=A0A1T5LKX6_9FIRM|nr:hypothetical protein [Maledivibacter halophilus]SKC76643.1 hypothetical protein SAMN02194393_03015 [Maledivibacter halophilus]